MKGRKKHQLSSNGILLAWFLSRAGVWFVSHLVDLRPGTGLGVVNVINKKGERFVNRKIVFNGYEKHG